MRHLKGFPKENLSDVLNIPVTREFKTLIVCYARALGFAEHTPVLRSMLRNAIVKAIQGMSEEERRLMISIAKNTILAEKIEEMMLNDLNQ